MLLTRLILNPKRKNECFSRYLLCFKRSFRYKALSFLFSDKSDLNISRVACSIRDFTCDNVGGFVTNLFAFDKFECACGALDFSKPTDIVASVGLECDVSGYVFTESNLDLRVAVDGFGIDISVTIFDGSTGNCRGI